MRTSKYRRYFIDLFRSILCIAVLLYHLGILKGGYLAVCSFFVLSAYLATSSQINKGDLNLGKYYFGRLKRVYLPLAVVVFLSIAAVFCIPDILWVSLKPEALSVLLGYNNFWQISANLDYFARHTDSPFMHLWYMAILIQFEIVFPFIFMLLKKAEYKKRDSAIWIISILSIVSVASFITFNFKSSVMNAYYNTLSRAFSLVFGIAAYFIFRRSRLFYVKDRYDEKRNRTLLRVLLVILCLMFVFVDSDSPFFSTAMIATSIISCFIVDISARLTDSTENSVRHVAAGISSVSYEVYLVQYPVIFLHQCVSGREERSVSDIIAIIVITFVIAAVLHYGLDDIVNTFKKTKNRLKQGLCILLAAASVFGCIKFIQTKDYTVEMKLLEKQLAAQSAEMEKIQAEYAARAQLEIDNWNSILSTLDVEKSKLGDIVDNMPITFIGDSVMLGASGKLHTAFPNSYCDSAVSRTIYAVDKILDNLIENTILGNPIVFHLGTNGTGKESSNMAVVEKCGDRDIFMINASNDATTHSNSMIDKIIASHPNVHKIDWLTTSAGHKEYFVHDGVHLTAEGQDAYVEMIRKAVYDFYLDKLEKTKEEMISNHEAEMNSRIAFFGNDLLLGIFGKIDAAYSGASFNNSDDADFNLLKSQIENSIVEGQLPPKLVFVFDNSFKLNKKEMAEILNLTSGSKLIVLELNGKFLGQTVSDSESLIQLDLSSEIKTHPEYLMADKVHLSEAGNRRAADLISEALKSE